MQPSSAHYDQVTDAWTLILGRNLHYGLFGSPSEPLSAATDRLITQLSAYAPITADAMVLDIGCGIGTPARALQQRFGCRVTGITNSLRGAEMAAGAGRSGRVFFVAADALAACFSAQCFDLAWIMESSHLIRDKPLLFRECRRVLKPGGRLLLCDLILKKEMTLADIYQRRHELSVLEASFGQAKMETLAYYRSALAEAGFTNIATEDVSREAAPTLDHWKNITLENKQQILQFFTPGQIQNFLDSCDILSLYFHDGIMGYGLATAQKQ